MDALVHRLDERLVEAYCGEKHARGNGDKRFQRAGTTTRTAVTTLGDHEFTLHYVEDTAATADEQAYFRPIEDVVAFDGQCIYQEDISAQAVELATTSSYRDAVARRLPLDALESDDQPPRRRIWKQTHRLPL